MQFLPVKGVCSPHEPVRAWGATGVGKQERKTYEPREVVERCIGIGTHHLYKRVRDVDAPESDPSAIGKRVHHGNRRAAAERGFVSSRHHRAERVGWDESAGFGVERHADRGLRKVERVADIAGYQHDSRGEVCECYGDAGESADWILERESADAAEPQHAEWDNVTSSDADHLELDDSSGDSFGGEHREHHRLDI